MYTFICIIYIKSVVACLQPNLVKKHQDCRIQTVLDHPGLEQPVYIQIHPFVSTSFAYCTNSSPKVAAKSLQSCPTLCDPIDSSPPAPPSLGFSRQEHGSGLPFPSPMHESEK